MILKLLSEHPFIEHLATTASNFFKSKLLIVALLSLEMYPGPPQMAKVEHFAARVHRF